MGKPDFNPAQHDFGRALRCRSAIGAHSPAQMRRISASRHSAHYPEGLCLGYALLDVFFGGELNDTEAYFFIGVVCANHDLPAAEWL